jgi:hypothetical protein
MISDTDLPHQEDAHQQPPLMAKKGNHIWKVIFILLLTVDLISFGYYLLTINSEYSGFGLLILLPYLMLLTTINFIAVLCLLYFYESS